MARKTDDPRTVKVRHPERGDFTVTPEVAGVLARNEGFEIVGGRGAPAARAANPDDIQQAVKAATEPLQARIDELEQQLAATTPDNPPDEGNDPASKAKEA